MSSVDVDLGSSHDNDNDVASGEGTGVIESNQKLTYSASWQSDED